MSKKYDPRFDAPGREITTSGDAFRAATGLLDALDEVPRPERAEMLAKAFDRFAKEIVGKILIALHEEVASRDRKGLLLEIAKRYERMPGEKT